MKTKIHALTTAMTDSIFNVLETMFFLPVDIDSAIEMETLQRRQDKGSAAIAAKLDFRGPLTGYSVFCIPKKLAVSITADFLGADEKVITKAQTLGTVNEIINMLVGDTFSQFDPQSVFDLGIPETIDFRKALKIADSQMGNNITIGICSQQEHLAFQMVST